MKKILQNLGTGETEVADVPVPAVDSNDVLIRTSGSLVSVGTERMLLEFGKANWVDKARQQPDKVRMVLEKLATDGLASTIETVRSKLDQPLSLGYSNVGVVESVGRNVTEFAPGDRVVSNGSHAGYVSVNKNLCAKIPDSVPDELAAFTILGAIGLQGIRLAAPTMGECVVVTGLGVIGLITVQLLRAQGCKVLAIDFDSGRLALAEQAGATIVDLSKGQDPLEVASAFANGRGVDAVLITASTNSNEPVHQAAQMCRKRGRIVLVGVAGLELSRADFYEKELSFQVSCSYGPGRYDDDYEVKGQDYPIGFVRWTEKRNFEAVLGLMAAGQINLERMISHRFTIEEAEDAYELITSQEKFLGVLLDYGASDDDSSRSVRLRQQEFRESGEPAIGFIGAGNYAGKVLIPSFRSAGGDLRTLVSRGGVTSVHFGKKFGFLNAATDSDIVFNDENIEAVVIATRHDSHADYVCRGIQSGKDVFVEKPLCLNSEELERIQDAHSLEPQVRIMVGFNRRFSPLVVRATELLSTVSSPISMIMTVNAGFIAADHWTQDLAVGGGRIVGEGCHFIDLMRFLANSPIALVSVSQIRDPATSNSETVSVSLEFENGSHATVHYLANGHRGFPKERLEIFCGGRVLQLDNFKQLRGWGWNGFKTQRLWRQDKGQQACVAAFLESIRNGKPSPIPMDEILEVSRISIEVQQALR